MQQSPEPDVSEDCCILRNLDRLEEVTGKEKQGRKERGRRDSQREQQA